MSIGIFRIAIAARPSTLGIMQLPTPDEIAAAAKAKGLTIAAMCRRADVDATAFHRWRAGHGAPNLATVQKMIDAIEHEPTPDRTAA